MTVFNFLPSIFFIISLFLIIQTRGSELNTTSHHHRVRRIVGGEHANYPPYDDPVVYVRFNGRSARVQGSREFPHYIFKGIKYAHPPVGADRFLRPKEKFLEGEVDATKYSSPCIQPVPGRNMILGSEDCLSLNIFTPDLPTGTEGLPVVVWIHGGGFRYGSASQYGVRHLVGQRLVVVTIQYRLGSLGFLSSGSKHLPGNAALWDMALAVQWIRNYIGFFGGNPHRIIVMGHDTGASSALLLCLTKVAKGAPNAVVAMSGTAVSRWAIDNTPANTANQIADQNGCPTANVVTMVKCLQQVSPESIIRGDSNIEFRQLQSRGFVSGMNGRLGTAPVAEGVHDGRSLPALVEYDPVESTYRQDNPKIPLLTGVTKDETTKAVNGHFKADILKQLTNVPDFLNKVLVENLQNSPVISRLSGRLNQIGNLGSNVTNALLANSENILGGLTKALPLNFDNYLKATKGNIAESLNKVSEVTDTSMNNTVGHGDELAYLFDAQDLEGNPLPAAGEPTEDDIKVRNVFTRMIADFARHGEISVDNKKVPSFNGAENNFVQIKPKPVLANKFKFCEMALWTKIGERLKSDYCTFLKALESSGVQQSLGGLNSKNILGPVLGQNSNKNNQNPLNNPLGLLGGNVNNNPSGNKQNPRRPLGGIIG